MAETDAEKAKVSGKERRLFGFVQKSKDFLLVVPLRSSDLKPDLPNVNAPSRELFDLVSGDVVIQQDHAADWRFVTISLTTPRRSRDKASRTASGEMSPRYSSEIAFGV